MIEDRYADAFGNPVAVSPETMAAMRAALGEDAGETAPAVRVVRADQLEEPMEIGYYGDLIVVPERAYVPEALERDLAWGIAVQLYALRSQRNDGIGDFGDLRRLAALANRAGAAAIALNPLHQSNLSNPAAASPYAPLSRRYLSALYIDVHAAAEEFGFSLEGFDTGPLRDEPLVDYPAVAAYKLDALERGFARLRDARPWKAFVDADAALRDVARYEAIMEVLSALDPEIYGWPQWPSELQDARGAAVERFAAQHADRVEFYCFLQWLADRQLARAARAARPMPIGLYRDLAVGVDLASADVWSDPGVYALGLAIGAPPDPLNAAGQNWGLPPMHPRVLRERRYAPFIALLRANMRHAGALRIDHVMGLRRLFCIPRALPQGGGAYVDYDFDAMLGILALESVRNRCMVVGEDLGTVPPGFREQLAPARVFSCRVLLFEREWDGRFRAPEEYPAGAVASTGTHDLPTLAGYWSEADVATRERLGWESGEAAAFDRAEHAATRERLLDALVERDCLSAEKAAAIRASGANPSVDQLTALIVAAYRYLARARSRLVLLQLEDGIGSQAQVNVPGTVGEEPNWRRKLDVPIEALPKHPVFAAVVRALEDERPRRGGAG
ncbi:MAG TPA: 4-alpha-glucanotransferase [Candidatus Baltobacteraceae bacterium]|nr:4-alpha-glucanotransferase [Candidatus Baltobacteraceae bacterium]